MGTKALIDNLHELTEMAYNSSVDFIKGKIADLKGGVILPEYEVESIYDMILDLCFDQRFVALFNELTKATVKQYPLLTADYSKAYQRIWGDEE